MTVWFTSDPHFGHRMVAEHRGFDDTEKHDAALVDRWTRRVRSDDVVWVLGDLAVSNPVKALEILSRLPGRKHLVAGNHDPIHPMHRNTGKWTERYFEVFETVQPFARAKWDGKYFLMSHFPYLKDRGVPRYTQYRLPDEGMWLLHGHTHEKYRIEGHEIHVGVDAWDLAPVSLPEILQLRERQSIIEEIGGTNQ